MADEIFIPINRPRMIAMTVLYGVLGFFCFLVTYYLGEAQDWVNPGIFKFLSVVVLLFFIIVAGTFAKNLKNKSAGLLINFKGIDDQSSSISHGFIFWKDIEKISKLNAGASKYMLVFVKKPQNYIEKAKNSAIKRLLNQNMRLYKTPVVINVGALSTNLDELEKTLGDFSPRLRNNK